MAQDARSGIEPAAEVGYRRPLRKGRLQMLEEAKAELVRESLKAGGLGVKKVRKEGEKAVARGEVTAEELREKTSAAGVTDEVLIEWLRYMGDPANEDPRFEASVKLKAVERLAEMRGLVGRGPRGGEKAGYGNITFVFAAGAAPAGGPTLTVKAEGG